MTALTNFNNFELNTEETTNVNGGRCRTRRRRTSYSNNCYSYASCQPVKYCEPAEEVIVEETPVIETPVIEAPESLTPPRGTAGL